ncbi:arylesterase [Chitinimonas lacunae]|uniref:Arylesterase n=1 Tax=Chitinimonas lacunae TaxID=1963018 RepID=A0ABV8MWG3_9NEIS
MARIFGLLILLAGGWISNVLAAEPRTILIFGDSLSAGYGIRPEQAWPSLLQQRIGPGWQVVNASQSGETTAGGLTRLPAALDRHKPQIVVVELGANDGLRGLPIGATRRNLAAMIEQARANRAEVVLVGMQMPPNFGRAFTAKFSAMYRELAQEHKLPPPPFLLDGIADQPQWFQADQLHPIAQAQGRLLDNLWPTLSPLLTRSQTTSKKKK